MTTTHYFRRAHDLVWEIAIVLAVVAVIFGGRWLEAWIWWMGVATALDVFYHAQRYKTRLVVRFWSCSLCGSKYIATADGGYKCARGCGDGSV